MNYDILIGVSIKMSYQGLISPVSPSVEARLKDLRETVEKTVLAFSDQWQAEVLYTAETTPGLLEFVHEWLITPVHTPIYAKCSASYGVFHRSRSALQTVETALASPSVLNPEIPFYRRSARIYPRHPLSPTMEPSLFEDTVNIKGLLSAIQDGLKEWPVEPSNFTIVNERARYRLRAISGLFQTLMTKVNEERRLEVQRKEAKEAQKRVEEEALRKERYRRI